MHVSCFMFEKSYSFRDACAYKHLCKPPNDTSKHEIRIALCLIAVANHTQQEKKMEQATIISFVIRNNQSTAHHFWNELKRAKFYMEHRSWESYVGHVSIQEKANFEWNEHFFWIYRLFMTELNVRSLKFNGSQFDALQHDSLFP